MREITIKHNNIKIILNIIVNNVNNKNVNKKHRANRDGFQFGGRVQFGGVSGVWRMVCDGKALDCKQPFWFFIFHPRNFSHLARLLLRRLHYARSFSSSPFSPSFPLSLFIHLSCNILYLFICLFVYLFLFNSLICDFHLIIIFINIIIIIIKVNNYQIK